ncbi:MAG: bifunctional folylpolyglutamate synthase/dihydrofolate synthase [Deltaproteobacteria bacterium]|nr:MAG: bifunctional folylpolyglutamate synthase/dihydrofolate synthase [Deltaproteobacteria bacterium]
MKNYQEAVDYVTSLEFFGIKLGLKNITTLLAALGNPHRQFKSVHIAGTNGKGSVGAMLSAIFTEAGYKVGLYTSPHLVSIRERFRINERIISEECFYRLTTEVKAALAADIPVTYFEFTTAMAFLLFAQEKVDLAIVETGMGGRLDATNVLSPELAVITNIGRDHEAHLGRSLFSITREKAGIIKPGLSLVTGVHQPKLLGIIQQDCLAFDNPIYVFGQHFRIRRVGMNGFSYQGMWRKLTGLEVGLQGQHQLGNAALALAVIELMGSKGLSVDEKVTGEGLKKVNWPGRQEVFDGSPTILIDGAHNPSGVKTLCRALCRDFVYNRLILIWGGMADKDHRAMLKQLAPMARAIIFTKPRNRRAADPDMLSAQLGPLDDGAVYLTNQVSEAINKAKMLAEENDLICIAGSLYLVGEAREIIQPSFLH